jgi:hypothetical protein
MNISECITYGFVLGGADCRVENSNIWKIGVDDSNDRRAIGGQFFGPNAVFHNNRVSELAGGNEGVGVAFSGKGVTSGVVSDSTFDGRKVSGQSFGIWNSFDYTVTVTDSTFNDWDYAFGGGGPFVYSDSRFERNTNDFGYAPDTNDAGGNTIIPLFRYGPGDDFIIGDTTGGRYYGSNDDDFIAGLQGHDHLIGGAGSDVFAFITVPSGVDKNVILDFQVVHGDKLGFQQSIFGAATDTNGAPRLQIGTEAVGNLATFLADPLAPPYTYNLYYYDPDGAGGARKIPLAYIPYYVPTQADLVWLDQPLADDLITPFGSIWSLAASGDFNRDGNTDLLWRTSSGMLGQWFMRDGERAATKALPAMPGWELLGAGDFNNDGTTDLLWQDVNGRLGEWFMVGGVREMTRQLPTLKGWELVATVDFNGDGTSDLLWQSASGVLGSWLIRDGQRAGTVAMPSLQGWELEITGDFNGDGTTDLLWQNSAGTVGEWVMDNFKRAATVAGLPVMKGWDVVTAADFNGDGTDDVLWQDSAGGALVAWMMQDGKPVKTAYYGEAIGSQLLAAGDIDGDGKADLMWRDLATSNVQYWSV